MCCDVGSTLLAIVRKQPRKQIRLTVSFIPRIMADAFILAVACISALGLQSLHHLAGLGDGYYRISRAVEHPHGSLAYGFRDRLIRIAWPVRVFHAGRDGDCWRTANAAAHRRVGGKSLRRRQGDCPRAVTAHGNPREVNAILVAVELFQTRFE